MPEPPPSMPDWRDGEPESVSITALQQAPKTDVMLTDNTLLPASPAQWILAWEEFGRRYPRLKRGAIWTNWGIFNGSGLSVLVILSFIYGWLPWWAFGLTLTSTTAASLAFILHFSGHAYRRAIGERDDRLRQIEESKPTLDILYDANDEIYRTDTTHPRSGIGYKTCSIGIRSSVGGTPTVFVPKVKDHRGQPWTNVFLKPAAHQREQLEASYPGYWFVLHWNTHTKSIKLLRVGNEECLLSNPAEFEIVARCAGVEKHVIARVNVIETEQEGTDASGKPTKIPNYDLQFRIDDI